MKKNENSPHSESNGNKSFGMKKLLLFLMLFFPGIVFSQFYNPNANQQAYNMGRAMALYQQGKQAVYNGDYDDALDKFGECTFYDYAPACEALGLMYELGIGTTRDTDFAWECYKDGASKGNLACKQAIQRITNNGFYSSSQKKQWLQNFRAAYAASYGGGSYYVPTPDNGNVDVDHSCRACNNTGVCNGCHGSGFSHGTTRCNMCNGSGRCMNCGGKGWH